MMTKEKLEKITKFIPAFDKRSDDPKKDYGIGCVNCFMVLKGKKGAVHFMFMTGMFLPETMLEYIKDKRGLAKLTSYGKGYFSLNDPMGCDVGYHSSKKMFDNQTISQKKCEWIDGPCYCDGSAMEGDRWMDILLRNGSDKIWEMLEEDYYDRFYK